MHTFPAPPGLPPSLSAQAKHSLGSYRWLRTLGHGALAQVDLVEDQRDGALYALKSVALADEEQHGSLRRELRLRSLLGHPQVPLPRQWVRDEPGGRAYLVLDFVDGEDLTQALAQLDPSTAPRILAQALSVVGWLHQQGVIHGDLKPANLCVEGLCAGGKPLLSLLDLGTAIHLDAGESAWIGGTPAYLAPYLKQGGQPEPKSDLYALGRSFQEALGQLNPKNEGVSDLSAVLERLTQADPDLAFGSAEDALLELQSRIPELQALELPLPSQPPLQLISSTLDLLRSQCSSLSAGLLRESLCVLEGAAGSGKSRLLRELAREAQLRNLRVLQIRCPVQATPLEPIIDLVSRLLPPEHPEHINLARVLGGSAQPLSGERSPQPEGPQISQGYLRRLARTLSAEGKQGSVLVLIDDLELADEDTISFLRLFSRLAPADGPLVIAAFTSGQDADSPAKLLLLPGERVRASSLQPMAEGQLRKLMQAFLPRRLADALEPGEWASLAEGNPRTAVEILRALAHQAVTGGEQVDGARTSQDNPLMQLVAARLAGLSPQERELLESLALMEQAAPLALLSELLEAQSSELLLQLKHLTSLGLVQAELGRAGRRYRLNSTLLGSELRRSLGAERQAAWHRAALEAWSRWPIPFERPTEMLAVHALQGGLMERAFELAGTAVRELGARGSLGGMLSMARKFQPHLDLASPQVRGELLCGLSNCLHRQGHASEAHSVLEELGDPRAGEAFRGADEQRISVLLMRATLHMEDGDAEAALQLLQGALALGEELGAGGSLGQLYERLGSCHFRLGNRIEARRILELGIDALEGQTKGVVLADILNNLGLIDSQEGQLEAASSNHLESLGIRRALGDLDGQSRSLSNLSIVEFYREEYAQAKEHAADALRIKRLIGMPATQALTLINLALSCRVRGELGPALAHIEDALELMESVGERFATAISRRALALILHLKGECRRARQELGISRSLMEEARIGASSMVYQVLMEGTIALDEMRWEDALALASEGIEQLSERGTPAGLSGLHKCVGRAKLGLGELPAALAAFQEAIELSEQGSDRLEVQWLKLWVGRTLARAGHPERAARHFQAVEQHARAAETPQLLAEALLSSIDLNLPGQGPEADKASLMEAEHLASRLGLPLLQMHAWHSLGVHAEREGLAARAQQWWSRGRTMLQKWLAQLEPEHREGFVQRQGYPQFSSPAGQDGPPLELEQIAAPLQSSGAVLRPEILSRLLAISSVLNAKRSRAEVLTYLRKQLNELFGAEDSLVVLVGRDGSLSSMDADPEVVEPPFSHTLVERVLLERKSVLIRDATDDPELQDKKSIHRLGMMSVLCAPLIVDDEPIGVIQFNHQSKPGPFTSEDLTVLDLFALQAATALKNMLLIERLDETIDQLISSRAELNAGEQLRALGQITAGVTHDFNNLLTILNGTVELIGLTPGLPEEVQEDLETLQTISQTASSTVRRLQLFRGQADPVPSSNDFQLEPIVRQAVELGARRFAEASPHEIRAAKHLPGRASGMQSELREVLLNLIVNAVEAMPDGGEVLVRSAETDGWVQIEVEDEGEGLNPELLSRIFEPFFSTKKSGHGLGLSISSRIIGSMGGRLEAEPRAPKGTRFRIWLPRAADS